MNDPDELLKRALARVLEAPKFIEGARQHPEALYQAREALWRLSYALDDLSRALYGDTTVLVERMELRHEIRVLNQQLTETDESDE